jgi:hypothetical protein
MSDMILTTFDWVPEMPRGHVRDIRVRWVGCLRAVADGGCLGVYGSTAQPGRVAVDDPVFIQSAA